MFISSVRAIEDSNVQPPGLFSKSIIVATPGREIQFTAPDQDRHELWMSVRRYCTLALAFTDNRHSISFCNSNKVRPLLRMSLFPPIRRL